jgi:putative transposase
MSRKYKFRDQDQLYFVSFAVINWIDVFIRNEYKEILLDSLRFCTKGKGLEIYAWCIMTSHVHLIIGTHQQKMEDILRDFKSYTSGQLKKAIAGNIQESRREWMLWMMQRAGRKNPNNQHFQFWQQHNKPIELFNKEIMQQKLDYLHQNPVAAGFVEKPEDYLYSSARDYCGMKGFLDIIIIE